MKKTILVAEDEPYVREVIHAMTDEIGDFDVVEAENGQQLLELAEKVRPDLIITDVIMPDIDAYHAIDKLKQQPEFRDTPVIFESALVKDREVFETHRPDDRCVFLTKPFKLEELSQAVSQLLGEK